MTNKSGTWSITASDGRTFEAVFSAARYVIRLDGRVVIVRLPQHHDVGHDAALAIARSDIEGWIIEQQP